MAQGADEIDIMINYHGGFEKIDRKNSRYPYCIVWTPIPILSWLLPFIGHMGICTSAGVIRDFAGSYLVSEDNMAFGRPTKYWKLDVDKVCGTGSAAWDKAVHNASEEYKCRPHNLCCDNCHSHVARALNLMHYDNRTSWNMVNLCLQTFIHGRHVSCVSFLKTWLPFLMLTGALVTFILTLNLH
ncbi:transmembrane protein 222-like [Salmo salar]|uniref:Transmembrane protein 222-like n=1 Tax=Salmo salar TaxID=8030 RepID=A0A1S3PDW7_SALSA|nr:transmembrane protein 222-like [Salmo salar]|eukprot:XP_014025634.1 PREDICTED: transmembrane protein 222-like [Salmo salar]